MLPSRAKRVTLKDSREEAIWLLEHPKSKESEREREREREKTGQTTV